MRLNFTRSIEHVPFEDRELVIELLTATREEHGEYFAFTIALGHPDAVAARPPEWFFLAKDLARAELEHIVWAHRLEKGYAL